jgi:hypothetical protein
MDGVVFQD